MTHSRREWKVKIRSAYKALRDAPEEYVDAAAEHASIGDEALALMVDRTSSYGLVWRQYGALNNLVRAATKVDRLMETWWFNNDAEEAMTHKDALDDALDAMNYLNFFIANARAGNITGTPPDRPKLSIVPDA